MQEEMIRTVGYSSGKEAGNRHKLLDLMRQSPLPEKEILENLALFQRRQSLSMTLFMNEIYEQLLGVHGVILEFGCRWGRNLAIFESLRGIYEPYNYSRRIVGFDTFSGFPSVHPKDGDSSIVQEGAYAVTEDYEEFLSKVLACHEEESPVSHIQKYQLVQGDVVVEAPKYFEENPETIVAFAYFDMDLYEPTKRSLEVVMDHVTKGSILGFDELNLHEFQGETIALKEVLGTSRFSIRRSRYATLQSYIVID